VRLNQAIGLNSEKPCMKRIVKQLVLGATALAATCCLVQADSLDDLARDFWNWRAVEQPISSDDIPRLERPAGWLPDWSPVAVAKYRRQMQEFESRWKSLNLSSGPVARQVDYRLIGSAIARVHWELDLLRNWERNPLFYLDQSLGAYFYLLLPPPPFDSSRTRDIVETLSSIPRMITSAKENLNLPVRPFASLALDELKDVRPRLLNSVHELKPLLDVSSARDLDSATERAIVALESYREWLTQRLAAMPTQTAVGRDAYIFFLKNVALMPYAPEQLLQMARGEWARSVAFQTYEDHRNMGQPHLMTFENQAEEIASEEKDESAVRRYLEAKEILTVPSWVQHYRFMPIPKYLEPLSGVGESDDFTGPSRLKDNGIRYIVAPSPNLGYFAVADAEDPRTGIVHEGVPGHYFQLTLSWASPDPIRRHYYDSGANEGIGFYAEEMMLEAGLFDDSPHTREIIYNFMRLRALRVEVDVKLASGEFTIEQGAEYLHNAVPMDASTAHAEAAFFASNPGQAISYQIGKLQILKLLADARQQEPGKFSLRHFHDFLWQNGNVPICLQRWELLNLKDDIEALERLH
jgi:Bacterial protein of unknown function (DUF885)